MPGTEILPVKILIGCDKPDALYLPGETTEFRINVLQGETPVSSGELRVITQQDGGPFNSAAGHFDLSKGNPVAVTASAEEPCFLLCQAEFNGVRALSQVWYRTEAQQKTIRDLGLLPGNPLTAPLPAASQDPPEPADFDAFWERTLQAARALPDEMKLEELPEYTVEGCRTFRFSMNTLNGESVHGFLRLPAGEGPFPVIAMFPGKGAPAARPADWGWGTYGCISIEFSVHKFRSPDTWEASLAALRAYEAAHGVPDYWLIGEDSPEKFHFYSVIPGFCRVLDHVTEKLPWDRRHLVLSGGSQGGWMSLVMGALYRDKVTALYAGVPACGLASALRPERERKFRPYYDGDYFARRVTAPALVATGLNDSSVARPDVICGMFPTLGSNVKKLEVDRGEHMTNPLRATRVFAFLMHHLGVAGGEPEKIPPFDNEFLASRGGMLRNYCRNLSEKSDRRREARLAEIRTAADFELYRKEIREKLRRSFGAFPKPEAIAPQVTGEFSTGKLKIEKVIFQSRPGFYVTADFYRPSAAAGKLPGILFLCGHSAEGKACPTYVHAAQSLALRGFGVLSVDPYGQGERRESGGGPVAEHNFFGLRLALLGEFFGAWRLHDALCALEYLKSRPEIDVSRLGVTGSSGGGTLTSYVNAFSDDITMAAPVCSITRMGSNLDNELLADCEQNPPCFRALDLEEDDLFLVRAPRPVMFGVQNNDFFDPRGTRLVFETVRKFYGLSGNASSVCFSEGEGEHGYSPFHQEDVGKFFAGIAGAEAAGDDGDIEVLSEEVLNCTPSGRVLDLPGASSALQMLEQLYREKGPAEPLSSGRLGLGEIKTPAYTKGIQQYIAPVKLFANRFSLQTEPGIEAVLKKLSSKVEKNLPRMETAVLFLPEADGLREVDLKAFRLDPENFYILELRGVGETLPARPESDVYSLFTRLYAACSLLFGDEIFLGRVRDLLSCLALFRELGTREVTVLASGKMRDVAAAARPFSPVKLQLPFETEENPWVKYWKDPGSGLTENEVVFGAVSPERKI